VCELQSDMIHGGLFCLEEGMYCVLCACNVKVPAAGKHLIQVPIKDSFSINN
jgi:hypothetical protein